MSNKNNKLPGNWEKSKQSIKASQRASQVAFELSGNTPDFIREIAAKNRLSPSDQIRHIIGLSVKAPVRPRLSISLSQQDYQYLAERYNLDSDIKEKIHTKIKEEIEAFYRNSRESVK